MIAALWPLLGGALGRATIIIAAVVLVAWRIHAAGDAAGYARCQAANRAATAALNARIAALAADQAKADQEAEARVRAAVAAALAAAGGKECRPLDEAARRRLDAIRD